LDNFFKGGDGVMSDILPLQLLAISNEFEKKNKSRSEQSKLINNNEQNV
jgi:hypothetical protein